MPLSLKVFFISSFNHIAVPGVPTSYLLTSIPQILCLYNGNNNRVCLYSVSLEHIVSSQLVLAIII